MKVLNYTTSWFAGILLLLISIWAALFYYAMLDEIYDSIDDGLDNQKGLIIKRAGVDSTLLLKSAFDEGDYAIRPVSAEAAMNFRDVYADTLMYMQNEEDFEPVRLLRTAFQQGGNYYQMQVITSMVEEDDLMAELFYSLLYLYIGLLASILVLNNFLLKKIWKPFYYLINQVKGFRLDKPLDIKFKKTRIDEFKLLNGTVSNLLQANIDAYNSQKQFIENAAHELQTPLAISINQLEALAETGSLSEEGAGLLASALDNLERLTRLNKSLLLLSRIENKQFAEAAEVNINNLVKKLSADFSDQLTYSEISLHLIEEEQLVVRMNPDLGTILLTNLVKNAIVHNCPGGVIHMMITKNAFSIENTGRDEPLEVATLFQRFSQEKRSQHSTGLGLAIVKAITTLFGLTITYSFNGSHKFVVVFR